MIANNLEGYLKRHENNNELVKERKKLEMILLNKRILSLHLAMKNSLY